MFSRLSAPAGYVAREYAALLAEPAEREPRFREIIQRPFRTFSARGRLWHYEVIFCEDPVRETTV